GLVHEQAGAYAFAHALIRQTILEELSPPRRQLLHLQAAEAIERVYAGDLTPHVAVLAEQYQLAGAMADLEKPIAYLVRAGEAAQATFAYVEAEAYLQTALDQLVAAGADAKCRADHLTRLARLRFTIGFHRYPE